MTVSRRTLAAVLTAGVLTLGAWAVVFAQPTQPPAAQPAPTIIRGESERGVSAAIKDAVDKVPAPAANATKFFRVTTISGQKTAKAQKVMVELEVRDTPFPPAAEKTAR